jgi:hypothetical protein
MLLMTTTMTTIQTFLMMNASCFDYHMKKFLRRSWCFQWDHEVLDACDDAFLMMMAFIHTHPPGSYEACCFVRSIYYHLSLFLSLLITVCCVRIRRYLGIHNFFFFFFLPLCLLPLQACNMGEVYWGTLSIQFSFGDLVYAVFIWGPTILRNVHPGVVVAVNCEFFFFLLALPFFRVETLWCTQKWTKVWYPYILWALQKECWAVWSRFDHQGPKFWSPHYRNISDLTQGSTWASPC